MTIRQSEVYECVSSPRSTSTPTPTPAHTRLHRSIEADPRLERDQAKGGRATVEGDAVNGDEARLSVDVSDLLL